MHIHAHDPLVRKRAGAGLRLLGLALVVALVTGLGAGAQGAPRQRTFSKPDDAALALLTAAQANDKAALGALFGPDSDWLLQSGDAVADRAALQRFLQAASERSVIVMVNDKWAALVVGRDKWSFPIPLVKTGTTWTFDTASGKTELLNRRIGRNELQALQVCHVYVDAQREYARRLYKDQPPRYAQKLFSSVGTMNGLFWPATKGWPESPLGAFRAMALTEGYMLTDRAQPYHGYRFRVLKAQGPHAPGGERNYVVDGKMTGGFALVAWPAQYGASGIMTFVVNQCGIVYQKDLGRDTQAQAEAMQAFDPDDTWKPVDDI